MAAAAVDRQNLGFVENNIAKPAMSALSCAAGGYLAGRIFTGFIAVNPAIAAIFLGTMDLSNSISNKLINYLLETCKYKKDVHKYTFLAAHLSTAIGAAILAVKVSAISATIFQLLSLIVIGCFISGVIDGIFLPSNPRI